MFLLRDETHQSDVRLYVERRDNAIPDMGESFGEVWFLAKAVSFCSQFRIKSRDIREDVSSESDIRPYSVLE